MPKERRDRSTSFDRKIASPFPCSSSRSRKSLSSNPLENVENTNEWEDARCPVCMEHPHNAILLMCSSHDKGCHPYMCDTSYRHSNCFDQFRKSFSKSSGIPPQPENVPVLTHLDEGSSMHEPTLDEWSPSINDATMNDGYVSTHDRSTSEGSGSMHDRSTDEGSGSMDDAPQEKSKMVCPLCRGQINGWIVVNSARRFMNAKSRSCSCETCDFNGTYSGLREHARSAHPLVRPSEVDPERQHNWRRLERQRDIGDLFSTLQSFTGDDDDEINTSVTSNEGGWLTVYFFVRLLNAGSTPRRRGRRPSRRLWGETVEEIVPADADHDVTDSGDDDN